MYSIFCRWRRTGLITSTALQSCVKWMRQNRKPPRPPSSWYTLGSSRGGPGSGRILLHPWIPRGLQQFIGLFRSTRKITTQNNDPIYPNWSARSERAAMTTLRTARLTLSLIARVVSGSHELFELCGHWNGNLQGGKHCIAFKKKKKASHLTGIDSLQ